MSAKYLAKAALLAITLTASAASVEAATQVTGFETSTLLAVAGCPGTRPSPSRSNPYTNDQYNNGYNQNNNGYNQNDYNQNSYGQGYDQSGYYTADDSNSPYATPGTSSNSAYSSSQELNRQGGGSYGNDSWNSNRTVSGSGSQSSSMTNEQRYSNSAYRSPSQSMGGGSSNMSRSTDTMDNSSSMDRMNDPSSIGTTR